MTATAADLFEAHRAAMLSLAYRMLGSFAEAEDVVQDVYLRWHGTDRAAVVNVRAYLLKATMRLCLDRLKSARARREEYVGPWLPEPVPDGVFGTAAEEIDADDLSTTLLLALERLSPLERAAFLLHDIFGMAFEEVARILDRQPAACRQLAARAREHVRKARPRFPVAREEAARIVDAFVEATRSGDIHALGLLLAENVEVHSDGGGRRRAALNVVVGQSRVARLFAGLARKRRTDSFYSHGRVNGLPAIIAVDKDGIPEVTMFDMDGGLITAIYLVRNPDKLRFFQEVAQPIPV